MPLAFTTSRRRFLGSLSAATLGAWAAQVHADERPPVTNPRATSGDSAHEPDWEQRLTITVGPKDADLCGSTDRVLQAAVNYLSRLGGGTVHVLPGEYRLRNAVHLASGVRILGSGDESVLIKQPSHETKLAADSDWYDQEITLENADGFEVGDGVCLRAISAHNGAPLVFKCTLVARRGNRFKLDRPLRENYWQMGNATAASLFPIITGEYISDFAIENITLDGNRAENDLLDGNYAGCIFLQDCNRATIRGVTARNYNGDGISWQICHDVIVENCHSVNNSGLGLHPGSGSQRPLIRNNVLEGNDIGIFFCWGVKYGLAEGNRSVGNRVGISIGHRDTDNLIRNNEVRDSREVGIHFRPERGPTFCAHRNRLEGNRVINSGSETGVAIDVQGGTEEVTIVGNELRETRGAAERIGIRLGPETKQIQLSDNQIVGFAEAIHRG